VLGRQVADMAEGRQNLVVRAEIFVDGLGLGGRLDDDDVHGPALILSASRVAAPLIVAKQARHMASVWLAVKRAGSTAGRRKLHATGNCGDFSCNSGSIHYPLIHGM